MIYRIILNFIGYSLFLIGLQHLYTITINNSFADSADSLMSTPEDKASLQWIKRINLSEHMNSSHCSPNEGQLSWMETMLKRVHPGKKLLETGILVRNRFICGFCHQRAYLLHELLRKKGFKTVVFGLNGHVVVAVNYDGGVYVVDPDYGVGPFEVGDLNQILPGEVKAAYEHLPAKLVRKLIIYYTSNENNGPFPKGGDLETIKASQSRLFRDATLMSVVAIFLALAIFWYGHKQKHRRNKCA